MLGGQGGVYSSSFGYLSQPYKSTSAEYEAQKYFFLRQRELWLIPDGFTRMQEKMESQV